MYMLALLVSGVVLLTLLVAGPVLLGHYWRAGWMVLAVALGAFVLTILFDFAFEGPLPMVMATINAVCAAGGAALARRGRWGWLGGLLVSGLGALVFGGVFLVDWVFRIAMGFM